MLQRIKGKNLQDASLYVLLHSVKTNLNKVSSCEVPPKIFESIGINELVERNESLILKRKKYLINLSSAQLFKGTMYS